MEDRGDSLLVRHWRLAFGGTALLAVGVIAYGFDRQAKRQDFTAHAVATAVPAPEETEQPVAEPTVSEVAEVPAEPAPVNTTRHVFNELAGEHQTGFWRDSYGDCRIVGGVTVWDIATDLEAKTGERITDYDWFDDGIVVKFKNGLKRPVWKNEIDCKDPPYNPLDRADAPGSSK